MDSARSRQPSRPFGGRYALFMFGYTAAALALLSVSVNHGVPPAIRILALLVACAAGTIVTIDMRRKLALYREELRGKK